ncbi:hypothetical protein IE53DRAFT_145897 [Violaceomyces palustris]|uniref:Uncharacterized protein n=1 Tax=Violaceomyces palustris TaxID=1673888 RepID=A0ACD0NUF3_9BASI|nr:hypothetical protein IE53DRAFT_145897 [Violaceomyces palustris]
MSTIHGQKDSEFAHKKECHSNPLPPPIPPHTQTHAQSHSRTGLDSSMFARHAGRGSESSHQSPTRQPVRPPPSTSLRAVAFLVLLDIRCRISFFLPSFLSFCSQPPFSRPSDDPPVILLALSTKAANLGHRW